MSQFLYFLPGSRKSPVPKTLKDAGLGHIADEVKGHIQVTGGPDGTDGIVFTVQLKGAEYGGEKPSTIGYYKDNQTWISCNNGLFWLGWETETPPQPVDLVRVPQLEGHGMKLGDGNEWHVPVARHFVSGTPLPKSLILGTNGEVVEEIMTEFIQYSKRGEDIFHDLCIEADWEEWGEEVGMDQDKGKRLSTYKQQMEAISSGLGLNYQMSIWEMSALKLVTTRNIRLVLFVIIDFPNHQDEFMAAMENPQKKKKKGKAHSKKSASRDTVGVS